MADVVKPVPANDVEGLASADGMQDLDGCVGRTMFDAPGAEDGRVTVVAAKEHIAELPLQALVRIESEDGRSYTGIVVSGPFAEPDGLSADSSLIVTTTVRGGIFMPRYHGRVEIEILGELIGDRVVPPRFRPLPNSPVFVLGVEARAEALHCDGDIRIGPVIGDEELVVGVPSATKSVLPRHTAVLGTTGGGKSTTMGRLISQAKEQGFAVVLLDTEGEYVSMSQPTDDPNMLAALRARGLEPAGIEGMRLHHLYGTETPAEAAVVTGEFGLSFPDISPYTLAEALDYSEAQNDRFWSAFEVGKRVLRALKVFPSNKNDERRLLDLSPFEEGYPELTLTRLVDIVRLCLALAEKQDEKAVPLAEPEFEKNRGLLLDELDDPKPTNATSWRIVLNRLVGLQRMGIFDQPAAGPLDVEALAKPGTVSVIDLSGTDATEVNNIVISDVLRRIQSGQDEAYQAWERKGRKATPQKVLVVIEEAHEFLGEGRASRMPQLYQQVARIAKRGRKRWLGLVFVTQLPQHLRRDVLALTNNYVIHRINDAEVIRWLRGVVPGIDDSLWRRLPALAPGQALVSFTHMARALLVAVDPSPCKLRMVD